MENFVAEPSGKRRVSFFVDPGADLRLHRIEREKKTILDAIDKNQYSVMPPFGDGSRMTPRDYMLFLDDVRMPSDVTWCALPSRHNPHWTIVRDYDSFVSTIEAWGVPRFIAFDHDLADEHYAEGIAGLPARDDYKEKTGMDCARWLVEYCMDRRRDVPAYEVHSMNPIGRVNIRSLLDSYSAFYNMGGSEK